MKIIPIQSYGELEAHLSGSERVFLLLYKEGSEQSECALKRISGLKPDVERTIITADVNRVRDIHEKLGVDTVPTLVVFRNDRVVNIVKGCQTDSSYDSIISGREIGTSMEDNARKSRQVTVYTTPSCSWCTTLKTYLDQQNVKYREINVAADTAAAGAMVRKSGQQGVPQTEINGQMIVGFDKPRINQLLEIQ
ncbi:MAG: thioredoxin family protein [Bacteroidota bacterium]